MNIKKTYCTLASLLLLVGGCQKDDTTTHDDTPHGFNFVSYLQEGDKITPLTATRSLTTDLAVDGYKMIGVTTSVPLSNGTNVDINDAGKIFWDTQTSIDGVYSGEKRNWVTDSKTYHSFYAYSTNPTGTEAGYGVIELNGVHTAHNKPYVVYKQHDDPTKQIDMLVINEIINIRTDINVPVLNLYFRHRFSRVAIMLYCTGGASLIDCEASITYRPSSVIGNGSFVITPSGTNNLSGGTYHSGTYKIHKTPTFNFPSAANTMDNAIMVGDLILIPQTVPEGYLTLDLKYRRVAGEAYRYARVDLEKTTLLNETQHSYYINLQEENINLSVTRVSLTPWNNESVMVDELK